jgi:glutamate-1-semialdehyde 2,1-aminomutase
LEYVLYSAGGRSEARLAQARAFVPGGINSCRRETQPVVCIDRAEGAYVYDADGRRLIDYHGAYGCIVLGHCHPSVVERVREAIGVIDLVGVGATTAELELARKLAEHVPSIDQVLLCNSGGEATYNAVRLARGVTGRSRIVKFQGCYHGSHDYVLPNALTVPAASDVDPDRSAGVLDAAADSVVVCRYNDPSSVEDAFSRWGEEIAGIIVEPILHNAATILPRPGFLETLRTVCDDYGSLLIFDEVITGFRHALGGAQSLLGVAPDVTTLAKAMGNGFPIGAIGGRERFMRRFNTSPDGEIFFSGTYNGNAVATHAALATIEVLEREPVHEHLFALGDRMRRGLESIAADLGVPACVVGYGGIYGLIFAEGPLETYDDVRRNDVDAFMRYKSGLLARGVLEMPAVNAMRSHICYAHTREDVDRTVEASAEALRTAVAHA